MEQKRTAKRKTSSEELSNAQVNDKEISALSRLRKERGQEDISQKIVFERHVLQPDTFEEDPEMKMFMTEKFSMTSMDEQLQIVQNALKRSLKEEVKEEETIPVEETKTKEEPVKEEKKKKKEKRFAKKEEKPKKERKKKEKKHKKSKTEIKRESLNEAFPVEKKEDKIGRFGRKKLEKETKVKQPLTLEKKLLFGGIAILLLLLAGYSYFTLIQIPQTNPTEEQAMLYEKLVEYADEWDMLSDTEKNELLDIEKDYSDLLSIQKSKINDYFKEQTGNSLTDVFSQLKKKQKEETNEDDPSYRVLYDYLKNWDKHTDNMKMAIITYKGLYDSLTPGLQSKINDFTKMKLDATFNTLYRQYNDMYVGEIGSIPVMFSAYRNQIKAEYERELEDLHAKYMELSTKETALQEQKKKYSQNSDKYKKTVKDLEYNEAQLSQVELLIDFYSQIVEQYNVVESSIYE
ncbi:MAG: hypothetical protein Q4C49_13350 [Bacillota bacterium]|nr:hypothetical protein [Bacillota bacterium]